MEWNKIDHPKPRACHDLCGSGILEVLGWAVQGMINLSRYLRQEGGGGIGEAGRRWMVVAGSCLGIPFHVDALQG